MHRHGEAGHIVNTASIAGLQVNPKLRNGSYAMTKYAVVAASEALAFDLEGSNLGVSVLCPAMVATTIYASAQRRPERLGGPLAQPETEAARALNSQRACRPTTSDGACSMRRGTTEFFIFTHEEPRAWIEARHKRLMDGFDSIARYNKGEGGA